MSKEENRRTGHLTKREQVTLGLTLSNRVMTDQKTGNRNERQRKGQVMKEFGLLWVVRQAARRQIELAGKGGSMFEPEDMRDDVFEAFETSKENLAWLLEQLDKVTLAGEDEIIVAELEDYLADVKKGDAAPRVKPAIGEDENGNVLLRSDLAELLPPEKRAEIAAAAMKRHQEGSDA
jgi:hypothetical protein